MNFAYGLTGSNPLKKKFKINATLATPGVPTLVAATGNTGIITATTTGAADVVGVTLDTATYTAAPTTATPEGVVTVITNPDAVYRIKMVGGATAGTALLTTTQTAASTTIVTITTGDPAPNSSTMLDGTIACISGANWGQTRKITAVAATTATVTVAWLNSAAIGDVFLLVPYFPGATTALGGEVTTLSTNVDEALATSATTATGVRFRAVDLEFDFSTQTNARGNSFVYAMAGDHIFKLLT